MQLGQETLHHEPAFRYLRLDVPLDAELPGIATVAELRRLQSMDDPAVIGPLDEIARAFVSCWDLAPLLP